MATYAVRSAFVRNPAFSLGVFLGVCFSGTGLAWLLVANRLPQLDPFASQRNLALAITFGVLGLVPAFRFMKSPGRSFLSGIIAWSIFTVAYSVAELPFQRLATRLSAFHLFVLGGVLLGLMAALAWVFNLMIALGRMWQESVGAHRSHVRASSRYQGSAAACEPTC
jgi:hypothetical protein